MSFLAHSFNNKGIPQLLKDHLLGTANKTMDFCCIQDMKSLFFSAGLLHDFGKYQVNFQNYLLKGGIKGSVPHARWGIFFFGQENPELAFVICGHHKGLQNRASLKKEFNVDQEEAHDLEEMKLYFMKEMGSTLVQMPINTMKKISTSERELLIRYLYSCLTDADWLDTERHMDSDRFSMRRAIPLQSMVLFEKVENYLRQMNRGEKINELRNAARQYALSKSSLSPGFFSMNLPTGLGKTLTSLSWALMHAEFNNQKRIIVVLPFISIIDQTAVILKSIFGDDYVLEHHSSVIEEKIFELNEDSNYSKRLACENWDYPIIVTTTVQFFESLFSNRSSKARKIHNIAESVIIFDEVQTLKKELVLPTLDILKDMNSLLGCTFLFCTATQPAFQKNGSFNGLVNLIPLVDDPEALFKKTIRVNYSLLNNGNCIELNMLIQEIKKENRSMLIIVNTKKTAMTVFNELKRNTKERILFLSTDLCPADRKQKIENIRLFLEQGMKIAVVSTQLIEAGVDFDFPVVFREYAPMESLIQAAGRCNREGKMEKMGSVIIFKLSESGMPDSQYKNLAEFTMDSIKNDLSLLYSYKTYENYYRSVINLFIDADKYNICENRRKFNFEDIAENYYLIDKGTKSIFIMYYNEESENLAEEIIKRNALNIPISRDIYSKIQQYSVQVYPQFLNKNEDFIQNRSDVLMWVGNYHDELGITGVQLTVNELII